MFNWVTADGFFAAPDGNLDWVVPDVEQARAAARDLPDFDTMLLGRRTYEIFEKFWPHVEIDAAGTAPDPHHAGRRSAEHGAIAAALNRMTKLVFSRTLNEAAWEGSRVIRELNPHDAESMKQQAGKDMIIFGSGSIVSQLTQHGLIDEYQFAVCPVFIGDGQRLFRDVSTRSPLDLLDVRALPSGDVLLRYALKTEEPRKEKL